MDFKMRVIFIAIFVAVIFLGSSILIKQHNEIRALHDRYGEIPTEILK
jgi:hypothetical protein